MRVIWLLSIITAGVLFANVGEISVVSGKVSVIRAQSELIATNGFKLEQKDEIKSGEDGKAQVLFKDGTAVTIGKNSTLKVEEFIFDEESKKGEAKIGMTNGVFKAITGQIGKINPENMKLNTKTATIGIRGTQILALVDEKAEKIACTEGAIYVDVSGYKVNVDAGQITTILAGAVPSAPAEIKPEDMQQFRNNLGLGKELVSKIESIKVDKNFNVDESKLKEVFDDINKIKESDRRVAALDLLEDSLINQVEAIYEGNSYKVATPKSLMVSYNKNDGYKPLSWGYYTQKSVQNLNDGFVVDGISYPSYTDAIKAALILESWRENRNDYTAATKIASFMGAKNNLEIAPEAWDGRSEEKKIFSYEGKILGFEKYTKVGINEDPSNAPIINIPFELNQNNKVKVTIDFGNRIVYGKMDFDKKGDKNEHFSINFVDGGKIALAPTSLFMKNYFVDGNYIDFIQAETYQGRFFGNDANQISFYTHLFYANENGDLIEAKTIDGVVIASKDDSKTVTLKKYEVGKDDYFSWGYWASSDFSEKLTQDAQKLYGAYILPNIEETPLSKIEELKSKSIKATYNANIIGTVQDINSHKELISKGDAKFDFDFAKGNVSGEMKIESPSSYWHVTLKDGAIDANRFEIKDLSNMPDTTEIVKSYEINGKLFGNEAQKIGGGFNLISDNKIAIGAFVGNR